MTTPVSIDALMRPLRIANARLSAAIIPLGATLVDLRLAGWPQPLVLGFPHLDDYNRSAHYAGAVIGRHANRIRDGRAVIDGELFSLSRNDGGNHLHGGETGFARQVWTVAELDPGHLRLALTSPDGHEGYPGTCDVEVLYEISEPATLGISVAAKTDRTTVVNICQHTYFNLSGGDDILAHRLQIAAERYVVSDADLIPTGELRSVAGGPFDFRTPRPVGARRPVPGFNHTYCLASAARQRPAFAARLVPESGPTMELWTTQPGLHFYDGYKLRQGMKGLDGRRYGPAAGLCLEAQNWPDSPNHDNFPLIHLATRRSVPSDD